MKRLSVVQLFNSKTFLLSSVLQIGDSREINTRSNVLAVQRQYELFYESEGEVTFPVFTKPIPTLDIPVSVQTYRLHESPVISVHSIYLIAASTASIVHIGSTSTIKGETRIKHIRQLAESTASQQASIRNAKDG